MTSPSTDLRASARRLLPLLAVLVAVMALGAGGASAFGPISQPTTYYVDCAGNDAAGGTTTATAWQSLARASAADLGPGDALLLRRGCTWTGTLTVPWVGTPTSPVRVDAYGTGALPLIQNGPSDVVVSGSYVDLAHLAVRADPVTFDTSCENRPIGRRFGFRFVAGATHDTLRSSRATDLYDGAYVARGANHIHILSSVFRNNQMGDPNPRSDAGGDGIALLGDDNEVAYDVISGSDACSRYYGRDGTAVEVFDGHRNVIHHNVASQNNNFVELGGAGASDNVIAYNSVTSTLRAAAMIVTRGANDHYGPVLRTRFIHNSGYLTGSHSYAVQCYGGCNADIFSMSDNVIWCNWLAAYIDGNAREGHDIFWASNGRPSVGFKIAASSRLVSPRFVDPARGNLQLAAGSPAIGRADRAGLGRFSRDLAGRPVPTGRNPDIGAYQSVRQAPRGKYK
jgi:hypothetical protein